MNEEQLIDIFADMMVQMVVQFVDSDPLQRLPKMIRDRAIDEAIDRLTNLRQGEAI
jgi:hypothetical protein